MATHLIIPDQHAKPGENNRRFDWIGKLAYDLKPDVIINMGDGADMDSLGLHDKGKVLFEGKRYRADLDAALDADDRLFAAYRGNQKGMPRRVRLIGNHEYRITLAAERASEFHGFISLDDLELGRNYTDVVDYEGQTPGSITIDGVTYCHFAVNNMGKALSGIHHAHNLVTKKHCSVTVAHSHQFDMKVHTNMQGRKMIGLVAGNAQEHFANYAGQNNKDWWRGVIVKRQVENGTYDIQQVSMEALRREYA